jgi:hypothetical protein
VAFCSGANVKEGGQNQQPGTHTHTQIGKPHLGLCRSGMRASGKECRTPFVFLTLFLQPLLFLSSLPSLATGGRGETASTLFSSGASKEKRETAAEKTR